MLAKFGLVLAKCRLVLAEFGLVLAVSRVGVFGLVLA